MFRVTLFAFILVILLGPLQMVQAQAVPSTGSAGSFQVGTRDLNFNDPNLNDPSVDVRIYYPGTTANPNAPIENGVFPIVAFGHGFNLNYLDYERICSHLASWGYIVVTPDVQNGFNVDHQEYARELAACIQWLESEGQNNTSDFFGKVDSVSGVFGHSMGGGASGLVPSVFQDIDAISGLAAAETNPSAIASLGNYSGPYQIISGSSDNTAPESGHQIPMYNAALGEKQWVSITGGAHCKFTDNTTICDLVSSPGSVSRDDQIYLSNKYITAFFNYYLKQDVDALPFLCGDSLMADDTNGAITYQTNINCTTVGVEAPASEIKVYPNPVRNQFVVTGISQVEVYKVDGQRIGTFRDEGDGEIRMDATDWSSGLYFLIHEYGTLKVCKE